VLAVIFQREEKRKKHIELGVSRGPQADIPYKIGDQPGYAEVPENVPEIIQSKPVGKQREQEQAKVSGQAEHQAPDDQFIPYPADLRVIKRRSYTDNGYKDQKERVDAC
jgi:hypothetical protein